MNFKLLKKDSMYKRENKISKEKNDEIKRKMKTFF